MQVPRSQGAKEVKVSGHSGPRGLEAPCGSGIVGSRGLRVRELFSISTVYQEITDD